MNASFFHKELELNNRIKMVFLDLDGTTLNDSHKITQNTMDALARVHEKGVHVVFTTGRSYHEVVPVMGGLEFLSHLPISYNNGSLIRIGSERLHHLGVVPEDVLDTLPLARKLGLHIRCQADEDVYIEELDDFFKAYTEYYQIKPVHVKKIEDVVNETTLKVTYRGEFEKLKVFLDEFHSKERQNTVLQSGDRIIDMTHKDASKLRSAQWICKHFGIEQGETMAVGDQMNDLALVAWVGRGIAMGNACEPLKEAADEITLSNNEEGVAHALQKLITLL